MTLVPVQVSKIEQAKYKIIRMLITLENSVMLFRSVLFYNRHCYINWRLAPVDESIKIDTDPAWLIQLIRSNLRRLALSWPRNLFFHEGWPKVFQGIQKKDYHFLISPV